MSVGLDWMKCFWFRFIVFSWVECVVCDTVRTACMCVILQSDRPHFTFIIASVKKCFAVGLKCLCRIVPIKID